jgi:hypothetical protein
MGSHTAEGCWASWSTVRWLACRRVLVAYGSAVPWLRPWRGWASPVTCSRIRCPRRNVCAMGERSNSTACGVSAAALVRRTIPSERLIDRPRGVTSQRRGMQVDVRQRCLHMQADPHRADHLKIGGLRVACERKNIRSGFEAAVVGRAGRQADGGTCDGRGRVRRVVAKPARRPGVGWAGGAEPASRMQIPGDVTGRRRLAGQFGPAAGTSNEHPHP